MSSLLVSLNIIVADGFGRLHTFHLKNLRSDDLENTEKNYSVDLTAVDAF